jgi:raffinose/stachyose/melibiose transport system permease protein
MKLIAKLLKWGVLLFFLVFTLLPLVWLVLSSFKTNFEFETQPFSLPAVWQFENYVKAVQISGLPRLFLNSVLVSTVSTVLNILITSMAAFVLSGNGLSCRISFLRSSLQEY